MTVGRAMLGGLIVAAIYIGGLYSIIAPYAFALSIYHAHAITAILFIISWTLYVLLIGYVFSAYKLLDMRWTTSWVRRLLE